MPGLNSWLHALAMASGSAFPRQLAPLADSVLQHPDIMVFGTCSSIAQRAGVSATTVSLVAGALGAGRSAICGSCAGTIWYVPAQLPQTADVPRACGGMSGPVIGETEADMACRCVGTLPHAGGDAIAIAVTDVAKV